MLCSRTWLQAAQAHREMAEALPEGAHALDGFAVRRQKGALHEAQPALGAWQDARSGEEGGGRRIWRRSLCHTASLKQQAHVLQLGDHGFQGRLNPSGCSRRTCRQWVAMAFDAFFSSQWMPTRSVGASANLR